LDTNIEKPEDPINVGYTFVGWFRDQELSNEFIFPAKLTKNITLYAKWSINSYTISFNSNGGSSVNSIIGDYESSTIQPDNPTKEGYTFIGWFSDIELATPYTFTTMPAENITLYAKWSNNSYTILFNSNGGSSVNSIIGDYESSTIQPDNPTKEGYTFIGWFSDIELTTPYTFTTMPAENSTLYAKWSINAYTISFNSNGGSSVNSIIGDYESSTIQPDNPTKEGHTFLGWFNDIELTTPYTFTTMPAENITLYAKWSNNSYTISFNSNGGSSVNSIIGDYESSTIQPDNPTKEGHTFIGWFSDIELTTPYTFTTMPAENSTLYAKWSINAYTISFNSNGGSNVDSLTVDFNSTLTEPTTPTKEEYSFLGWFSDINLTTPYTFTTMPAENITLYAKWSINKYTVTYDGTSIDPQVVDYNTIIPTPNEPIRDYYSFGGWYIDSEYTTEFDFDNPITKDITIYAKWIFIPTTDLTYLLLADEQSYKVTAYEGTNTVIRIPKYYNGLPVTEIGNFAFANLPIENLVFEDGSLVTTFGAFAFVNTEISDFYLPENLTTIGHLSIFNPVLLDYYIDNENPHFTTVDGILYSKDLETLIAYPSLRTGSYTIPNTVLKLDSCSFISSQLTSILFETGSNLTEIGPSAFTNTLIESITIPNTVTIIGDYAFDHSQFNSILFEENSQLSIIGSEAFRDSKLISITIPSNVISINDNAFSDIPSLESINVNPINEVYSSNNGVLFNKDLSIIIKYPEALTGSYTIPSSVIEIGFRSFSSSLLTEVIIPNGVTKIGDMSFNQSEIISIIIPNSVISLGSYSFSNSQLASIQFEEGSQLTTIGTNAFSYSKITSITIPSTVTDISNHAFYSTNLTTVIFEGTTPPTYIGAGIFNGITSLSFIIYVPYSSIGSYNTSLIGYVDHIAPFYTVTYNSNTGSTIEPIILYSSTTIQEPTQPYKEGYTFGGWYSNSELTITYDFNTIITSDITLYAKWM